MKVVRKKYGTIKAAFESHGHVFCYLELFITRRLDSDVTG